MRAEMASAKMESRRSKELINPLGFPDSKSQSESDRRMAMRHKALEIKIQEDHLPVMRINLRANNAAVSWRSTAIAWSALEARKVRFIYKLLVDL
jgi:hypothetical protein